MGPMAPLRSLRVASAVFIIISVCATFHLITNEENVNLSYQVELPVINKTFASNFHGRQQLAKKEVGDSRETKSDSEAAEKIPLTKDGFLVWNPNCQIADMDPFDKSIKHVLRPAEKVVCSRLAPLTYTTRVAGRQLLRVNEGVVNQYLTTPSRLKCCLSIVTRRSENENNVSSCKDFIKEIKLNTTDEYLLVRCRDKKNGKKVYTNMHAVVQVKVPPPASTSSNLEALATPARPSVLLVGIDSMSRLNMLRTMPRTVSHLRHSKWLELRGYNKMGDNTLPNLMAILTGLGADELKSSDCWPRENFDSCQFIWKDFKDKGYVTAYAEDEPTMGTFNYHKGGFTIPPTDYYFRPFMLEAIRQLKIKRRDGLDACLGPTSTTEHFLRFAIDLATTFTNSLFAMIWLNNFSHNNHNTPAALDNRFEQFLQELSASGVLNTTLVVFFSDHGSRFGKIRNTYIGWVEERLPFFYLWVPEWFQKTYPEYYNNLRDNGDRLTSPYDLHLTLKDVVMGLENVGTTNNGSGGCPTCVSLFTPISQDRGCKDAGIPPHWCTCAAQAKKAISGDVVKNATHFVINEIRTKLSLAGDVTANCATLKLKTILDARLKVQRGVPKPYDDYIVVFDTQPGGQFDATVRHWQETLHPHFELLGSISRIDSYDIQSTCMTQVELKLYCICIDT